MTLSAKISKLGFAMIALAALSLNGCSKKDSANVDENPIPSAENADTNTGSGDSDSGNAMGIQSINFPYDSYELDGRAKEVLKQNAQVMKDKGSIRIQIEGHCDERGGIQYNIALGEKRANSVRKYLIGLGVAGDRMTTISFGKEKLIDASGSEAAHAKNRRANFVITSR